MKPPPPTAVLASSRSGWGGFTYRLYFLGSGVGHYLAQRVRPAGIGLGLVMLLALCLMSQRGQATYQLFSLTVGMAAISIPWAWLRRASLSGQRDLPRYASVGETLCYAVTLTTPAHHKLRRAWLADSPPDARPSPRDFTQLREPGEEERNPFDRHFAYYRWQWLQTRNRRFDGGVSAQELTFLPGEGCRILLEITPLRRGLIHFNDLRVILPDPFGLFQGYRRIASAEDTLTVLPQRFRLPELEFTFGPSHHLSGPASRNSPGHSSEFLGLRDYRHGDPMRQIHWRSWARTGRPIVKELEENSQPHCGLVVDTSVTVATNRHFEMTLSVAASFAAPLSGQPSFINHLFVHNRAQHAETGHEDEFLKVLATLDPQPEEPLTRLAEMVLRQRGELSACLIILNGWDSQREDFLKSLSRHGLRCILMVIGDAEPPSAFPGHWLRADHLEADLMRLPPQLSITS